MGAWARGWLRGDAGVVSVVGGFVLQGDVALGRGCEQDVPEVPGPTAGAGRGVGDILGLPPAHEGRGGHRVVPRQTPSGRHARYPRCAAHLDRGHGLPSPRAPARIRRAASDRTALRGAMPNIRFSCPCAPCPDSCAASSTTHSKKSVPASKRDYPAAYRRGIGSLGANGGEKAKPPCSITSPATSTASHHQPAHPRHRRAHRHLFRYKNRKHQQWRTCTLTGHEFHASLPPARAPKGISQSPSLRAPALRTTHPTRKRRSCPSARSGPILRHGPCRLPRHNRPSRFPPSHPSPV